MQELDDLIAVIVVDCYDDDERMMAFCTVLRDEIPLPCETVFLGMPVDVIAIGAGRAPGVMATRRRGGKIGEVGLTSLAFPDGSVAVWLQADAVSESGSCPSSVRSVEQVREFLPDFARSGSAALAPQSSGWVARRCTFRSR